MAQHCCEIMRRLVEMKCEFHPESLWCSHKLVYYEDRFEEYGIIHHDTGNSFQLIHYCPWCRTKLRISKRLLWETVLEQMGFEDPFWTQDENLPVEFHSNKWLENIPAEMKTPEYLNELEKGIEEEGE